MTLDIPDLGTNFEIGRIGQGRFKGIPSYYRDALYSIIKHFDVKTCLEIGTHIGQTSNVIRQCFEKYRPDGKLVTVDIKTMTTFDSPNIAHRVVHPYVHNSTEWHYVTEDDLLEVYPTRIQNVNANIEIINKALASLDRLDGVEDRKFDLVFVDGDHQEESVFADFYLAEQVSHFPHRVFMDNIEDLNHDSPRIYHEHLSKDPNWNTYHFKDWHRFAEAALIWKKTEEEQNEDSSPGDAS